MSEAARLRALATELHSARRGLPNLLQDIVGRHRPATWSSRSADTSRSRLRMARGTVLAEADIQIAAAAHDLLRQAALLDAVGESG